MKRRIIATTIALGLVCTIGISVAQDSARTTTLPNVSVSNGPGQYETYDVELPAGYGLEALVGRTHPQYMQAMRAAEASEVLRRRGMVQRPVVTVAIDNSGFNAGAAEQFLLSDPAVGTVAIVDVYCKQVVPSEGRQCRLVSESVANHGNDGRLAVREAAHLQLAVAGLRD